MATLTKQAALSYNGITTLSNIAVGELVEVLTVTKTAADETYTAGGVKTFAISLVNASAAALTGLTVTDTLGSYTSVSYTHLDVYKRQRYCGGRRGR